MPQAIADLEQKLMDFRKHFRKTVGYPSANYVSVSGVQVSINASQQTRGYAWPLLCCTLFCSEYSVLGSNVYMNLSSNRSGQAKCYNEGTKCCNEYRATA